MVFSHEGVTGTKPELAFGTSLAGIEGTKLFLGCLRPVKPAVLGGGKTLIIPFGLAMILGASVALCAIDSLKKKGMRHR